MQIRALQSTDRVETLSLFRAVFTESEGAEEGKMLEALVSKVFDSLVSPAIIGFGGYMDGELVAAIFFSQLEYPCGEPVYLLSPVAVSTAQQRKGLGKALIEAGLEELKGTGVSVVLTYGDPAYYGRFGFETVSIDQIGAPYPLSMPIGWLGLFLVQNESLSLTDSPKAQRPFADPAIW